MYVCRKQKVRIDKKRLQSLVSGQRAALNQLTSAMEDCLKQIGTTDIWSYVSLVDSLLCVSVVLQKMKGRRNDPVTC